MKSKKFEIVYTLNWKYFFGGHCGKLFDRYYETTINGIRVERHSSNRGTRFAIGNIDQAKKKYKTEGHLLRAVELQSAKK